MQKKVHVITKVNPDFNTWLYHRSTLLKTWIKTHCTRQNAFQGFVLFLILKTAGTPEKQPTFG